MTSCGSILRIIEKRNEENVRGEESSICKINTFHRQTANLNDDDE